MKTGTSLGRLIAAACLTFALAAGRDAAASIEIYSISITNDGTADNNGPILPPYGTVTVSDNVADVIKFTIDLDNTKLLGAPDIHEFGFMLNFGSSISLSPTTELISGQAITLTPNEKVAGTGNTSYDYVVSFGNGGPKLEPVEFQITGIGLDLNALDLADTIETNTDKIVNFALHVQNTSTLSGSEALGGLYDPVITTNGEVPEPSTLAVFGLLSGLAGCVAWRKNRLGG